MADSVNVDITVYIAHDGSFGCCFTAISSFCTVAAFLVANSCHQWHSKGEHPDRQSGGGSKMG